MIKIRENIMIIIFVLLIGYLNIIKDLEKSTIFNEIPIKRNEIIISVIMVSLYYIINKWIQSSKEIDIMLIINLIGLLLFINISKEIGIIFILLELYSMTIYILINYNNNGLKTYTNILYFYINSISSLILLLLIAIIYIRYGIININDYIYIKDSLLLNLLVIILLFKSGAFPFQYWILKVYKELDIKILLLQTIFTKFLLP